MTNKTIHIKLRPNEKIFLNGAVLRVDRKVTIELLNDAIFLLESHVMQVEDTKTPLKQLYFAAQIILIDPKNAEQALGIFSNMLEKLLKTFVDELIVGKLQECAKLAQHGRFFEILKILHSLFDREEAIITNKKPEQSEQKTPNLEGAIL